MGGNVTAYDDGPDMEEEPAEELTSCVVKLGATLGLNGWFIEDEWP